MPDDFITYSNIREILGPLIGHQVIDITQHDPEEFKESGQSFVMFHFDDGSYVQFIIGEPGFHHNVGD